MGVGRYHFGVVVMLYLVADIIFHMQWLACLRTAGNKRLCRGSSGWSCGKFAHALQTNGRLDLQRIVKAFLESRGKHVELLGKFVLWV